ncbi:ferredoxin [Variovorax sp. J2P1-59]|uniref:ferredoxin n=1 Tax=Variovorax flavidus TaxID=3053501 RepID=UPI0025769FEB|nr:ferredoxin [Variovorax sp. J2P1-59]MDM0077928.1 ferredoxin [Variovorax sp. J2P1-59]
MYVILTSKPGQFRTELVEGLRRVESADYLFFGRCKARFVIAEVVSDCRITVIDEVPPETVNHVPIKFFEKFTTVERARKALRELVHEGDADVVLVPT